ncbi:MAG: alpha-ketoglutarate-dependent dioxygenase AlkB family protein [Cyanobacteriota bacterium]
MTGGAGNSGSPKPLRGRQFAEPRNGQPQSSQPENGKPQSREPENGDPQSREPENGDPQSSEAGNGNPQTSGPGTGDPRFKQPLFDGPLFHTGPTPTDPTGGPAQATPTSATSPPHAPPRRWDAPGLHLELWPAWLASTPLNPRALRHHLEQALPWSQPVVTVFGKRHPVPRLTCWVGDPGCTYRYSGLVESPQPWTDPLLQLREHLQTHLGMGFNSLLLNRYRDGRDRMGWHADDEPELAAGHPIASLSLGASRTLRFRPRPGRLPPGQSAPAPLAVTLADGDLLVMREPTQTCWHHSLPARQGVKAERFNLTFRQIPPKGAG